jgi:phage anti-repressor protein/phage antirepressor YoqD-like protein
MSARQPHELMLAAQQPAATTGDLIKVRTAQIGGAQVQTVEARDLYLGLGLARAEWSRWAMRNIEGDTFFVENKDWAGFVLNTNGNDIHDYAISLEFAKHLAMMARTEKAHDYRNYFLECERRALSSAPALPNFADPAAAARAWADEVEAKQLAVAKVSQLQHQVAQQAPAVAGLDRLANAAGTMCVSDAAKVLQIQPSKLTDLLLAKRWMYHRPGKPGYLAYQDKLQSGNLRHKLGGYPDPDNGEWKVKEQVLVTRKGLTNLAKIIAIDAAEKKLAQATTQHQHHLGLDPE